MAIGKHAISRYHRPLNLVEDRDFEQYIDAVEEVLDEKLDQLEDSRTAAVFDGTEREAYEELREYIDDIEDKLDLYDAADQAVETESAFPDPFSHLGLWSTTQQFMKSDYVEEVFREARGVLENTEKN
jgi:hypothetical protein